MDASDMLKFRAFADKAIAAGFTVDITPSQGYDDGSFVLLRDGVEKVRYRYWQHCENWIDGWLASKEGK